MELKLGELLPEDLARGLCLKPWQVPDWAFQPDQWNWAFLRGLRLLSLEDSVWEVGVGTGLITFFLRMWFPKVKVFFSDYDARCIRLVFQNLTAIGATGSNLNPLDGSWDLVTHKNLQPPKVDVIVGCIPQALLPQGKRLADGDNEAHYYNPAAYPESLLHHLGLGLNEALLIRARQVLLPGGRIVLNLGGRPGKSALMAMFSKNGYCPRVVHEEIIEQLGTTCLQPFVDLETAGAGEFEFFADSEAKESIASAEAERRRITGQAVFHKIYVIEGAMI